MIPGLKKYIQCHAVEVSSHELEIDGIAEFWWDDVEAYQNYIRWRRSTAAKLLREDEKNFIDMSQVISFVGEEKIIKKTCTKAS